MHAVNLYVDEALSNNMMSDIKSELMSDGHVMHVACHQNQPHDFLVEYEEKHLQAMDIVHKLESHGLHVDITSG